MPASRRTPRRSTGHRRPLALVALSGLLAAAACGGGGHAEDTTQRAAAAAGAQPKDGAAAADRHKTATNDGRRLRPDATAASHGDADFRSPSGGEAQPGTAGPGAAPDAGPNGPRGNPPPDGGGVSPRRPDASTGSGEEKTTTTSVTPDGFTSDPPPRGTEAPPAKGDTKDPKQPESDVGEQNATSATSCMGERRSGPQCGPPADRMYHLHSGGNLIPDPNSRVYDKAKSGVEKFVTQGYAQGVFANGERLAVTRWDAAGHIDLWAVDRNGGGATQVTHGMRVGPTAVGPADTMAVSMNGPNVGPAQQPGSWNNARIRASDARGDSDPEIFAIGPDGSMKQLTHNRATDTTPSWSPDGARIAYASNQDGNFEIYVMDAAGGNVVRLTDTKGDDFSPTWSPDGRRIAYAGNEDGDFDIYVMPADGGESTALTDNDVDDGFPTWSAKQGIAFSRVVGDSTEIFILGRTAAEAGRPGAAKQRLTANDADDLGPAWAPDGEDILISRIRTPRKDGKTEPEPGR
ncbi:MAG: eukaryotic-like serine/threonine-protein kinase [Actinomycetota bacterium]|nr:eukaryotic-like serine/threonine-protein kinase [Actinomycetota bacterium]